MTGRDARRAAEIAILIVLAIFLHPSTSLDAGRLPAQLVISPVLALIGIVTFLLLTRMVMAWATLSHTFSVRPLTAGADLRSLTCVRIL